MARILLALTCLLKCYTTGISPSTIYSIIDRDTDNVGLDKVKKIEQAIGAVPVGNIYNMLHGIKIDNSTFEDFIQEHLNLYRDVITEWAESRGYEYSESFQPFGIKLTYDFRSFMPLARLRMKGGLYGINTQTWKCLPDYNE